MAAIYASSFCRFSLKFNSAFRCAIRYALAAAGSNLSPFEAVFSGTCLPA